MVVQTHERRNGPTGSIGLLVGAQDVQAHFPREEGMVELELDHLCIVCPLDASFWEGRPEIHDYRLSSWLESKRNSGKMASQSAPVALIASGKNAYRLQILAKDATDRALTAPIAPAYFAPVIPVAALLERRKHNVKRVPERRKVARLSVNERPSTPALH